MISSFSIFFASAVVSLLITFPLLWLLGFFKLGQPVRKDVPAEHRLKAGTPTMGGVGIILSILILSIILINVEFGTQYLALLLLMLAYALIGLIDDLIKVLRRENLGLTFWQKIILQILVAMAFSIFMVLLGHNLTISGYLARMGFGNPYFYQLLMVFMIVGSANATNLTDGLNGLLAGTAGIAFLSFAVLATKLAVPEAAAFSLIAAGATGAFLYFNFPKAKLFMGDVGSLALGAALAGIAIILHKELSLLLIGAVFVLETMSVILQVASYKLFKRRIFKTAPLHHHFEMMGIKELTVVIVFWAAGLVCGLAGALFLH